MDTLKSGLKAGYKGTKSVAKSGWQSGKKRSHKHHEDRESRDYEGARYGYGHDTHTSASPPPMRNTSAYSSPSMPQRQFQTHPYNPNSPQPYNATSPVTLNNMGSQPTTYNSQQNMFPTQNQPGAYSQPGQYNQYNQPQPQQQAIQPPNTYANNAQPQATNPPNLGTQQYYNGSTVPNTNFQNPIVTMPQQQSYNNSTLTNPNQQGYYLSLIHI